MNTLPTNISVSTIPSETETRREFLVQAASMLGIAVSAGTAITLLNACESTTMKSPVMPATTTASDKATINIAQENGLQAVGGAIIKSLTRTDAGREVVIIRSSSSQFLVFSAVCTHSQCTVDVPRNNVMTCQCHGSRYSATDGSVINGPAPLALKKYTTSYDAASTTLTITF
jgi:Rieske Fe-S protein